MSDPLRVQHARSAVVADICGGTLAIARAGLLDTLRHSSNDTGSLTRNAQDYAGSAIYAVTPPPFQKIA